MNTNYQLRILYIVHNRLAIEGLLEFGLNYSQIAKLLSDAKQNGLIEYDLDGNLILTTMGRETLEKLNRKFYPRNHNVWLLPEDSQRAGKFGIYDVYFPRKQNKVG